MKKVLLATAGLLCLFAACNNPKTETAGTDTTMAQKNLDAVHVVNKAFETGDISKIDSVVAADYVDHTDKGEMGRDSFKAMIIAMHRTAPDMKMELIKEVADHDYVFEMMRYTGTGDGVMMPAGPYDMHAVEVIRFKDGKGVEHWSFVDAAEMMKMMGQMQHNPAAGAVKTDTTAKHK